MVTRAVVSSQRVVARGSEDDAIYRVSRAIIPGDGVVVRAVEVYATLVARAVVSAHSIVAG